MMTRVLNKWDFRFLEMARLVAGWSKDPSTKVGAVIVRPDRTVASVGFNGFARGVADLMLRLADRAVKYPLTIHAEENAILSAHERLEGCILYSSMMPCGPCASRIVQAGIKHVVCEVTEDYLNRWAGSVELTKTVFSETGVRMDVVQPFAGVTP
jgi:dCMP deaminase